MSEHRTYWSVAEMCRVFKVSRSGYYRWLGRGPSRREVENRKLDAEIREIYDHNKGRYGSPKITQELKNRGWRVSKNRVAKRMREMGLRSVIRRKYRVTSGALKCSSCNEYSTQMDLKGNIDYTAKDSRNAFCVQCHGYENPRPFDSMHNMHVTKERGDCSWCHTFSRPERGLTLP
jgi:hypothetical protein